MGHWNHRVIAKKVPSKRLNKATGEFEDVMITEFGLHEVFYDDNGKPDSFTEESLKAIEYDEDDEDYLANLKQTLEWMRAACDKPILDYEKFPKVYVDLKRERKKKLKKINDSKKK